MMLGKRARPPMKRTSSMTEFAIDLVDGGERVPPPYDPHRNGGFSSASPRGHRRISADFVETASFLRACSLCKRRLIPGHDIYMYRGNNAFCSEECRHDQMTQDERKEKQCSSFSSKNDVATAAAVTHFSAASETVAAAV